MIEVIDRNPTYPGRVKMTPVAGQENTYDMVRADIPVEAGTPINKALFDSIGDDIFALTQNVSNIINAHASMATLGSLPLGGEFGLYENGILVPFIKVGNEYNGVGRCVVVRKNIYKMSVLTGNYNVYANSVIDTWLNNDYLSMLDSSTKSVITAVNIPCAAGKGSIAVSEISQKVFLLSLAELGITGQNLAKDGTALPFFKNDNTRLALYNGAYMYYWTRTPSATGSYESAYIANPYAWGSTIDFEAGVRPVFTLPYDFEVNANAPNAANTVATAEVI